MDSSIPSSLIDDIFSEYDMMKKFTNTTRAFTEADLSQTKPSLNIKESNKWERDPSGNITRQNIKMCMINIRRWYTQRASAGLPPLMVDHKCTKSCHTQIPIPIHNKPLVYGCELSGVLHFCNNSVECEWTYRDRKSCSTHCIFSGKLLSNWVAHVDQNYSNFHALRTRDEIEDFQDYFDGEEDDDNDYCLREERESLNEVLGLEDDDAELCSFYPQGSGGWENEFSPERGDPPLDGFDSHKRIHNTIFETLDKQRVCNTYNPQRVKRRRKTKERTSHIQNTTTYDSRILKNSTNPIEVYQIETGIPGDFFYICTPNGDTLGYTLAGEVIPVEEYLGESVVQAVKEKTHTITLENMSIRKPLQKNEQEGEQEKMDIPQEKSKENDSKRIRCLLSNSKMEELDAQALNSEEFRLRLESMTSSFTMPLSHSYTKDKRKRGPEKGYKKRFNVPIQTANGEDIGIIGYNSHQSSNGIPKFSTVKEMEDYVNNEKRALGYYDGDIKRSEELEDYDIYHVMRDKLLEKMNSNIEGYLTKKERYQMKKNGMRSLKRFEGFKTPLVRGKSRSKGSLSLSGPVDMRSPLRFDGTPVRMSPLTRRFGGISMTPSPLSTGRTLGNTPMASPGRTPLIFGTPVRKNISNTPSSLALFSGSTPSRSLDTSPLTASAFVWKEKQRDVSSMRKWPIGKSLKDQKKVVDIVTEHTHRIIIDLLVDRSPRRSIAKIKKLSMMDEFKSRAEKLYRNHGSYKTQNGMRLPIPVNYHIKHSLWKSTCERVIEKKVPHFPIEYQRYLKEIIVKAWMLLSRKKYSQGRNRKKSSLFCFIVGMLYLMANGGYVTKDGLTLIDENPWLKEHLPTADDMDILNKRKIGFKSNRGFSCKGSLVSKSVSVAALSPSEVKVFGDGSNRTYTRKILGEGVMLVKYLFDQYEQKGPSSMENVRKYLYEDAPIDSVIVVDPITHT